MFRSLVIPPRKCERGVLIHLSSWIYPGGICRAYPSDGATRVFSSPRQQGWSCRGCVSAADKRVLSWPDAACSVCVAFGPIVQTQKFGQFSPTLPARQHTLTQTRVRVSVGHVQVSSACRTWCANGRHSSQKDGDDARMDMLARTSDRHYLHTNRNLCARLIPQAFFAAEEREAEQSVSWRLPFWVCTR